MRAYFFGNMYLSSIQQGIQAAHVVAEMSVKYYCAMDGGDPKGNSFHEWAAYHKTMILLNGGYSETIHELVQFFDHPSNSYPWASFHEGQDALDGALTDVGIILPEKIYNTAAYLRSMRFSDKEDALTELMDSGSLVVPAEVTGGEVATWDFNKWEYNLLQKLNDFGMAK